MFTILFLKQGKGGSTSKEGLKWNVSSSLFRISIGKHGVFKGPMVSEA